MQAWAVGVHDVYVQAVAWAQAHPEARGAVRQEAATRFARELQAVSAPWVEGTAPQRPLSARMARHLHELFVCVVDAQVPPDNNAAERSLRGCPPGSIVTSRKISGGTRSAVGSATKMTLATLFGTWRLHGVNPLPRLPRSARFPSSLNSYKRAGRGLCVPETTSGEPTGTCASSATTLDWLGSWHVP